MEPTRWRKKHIDEFDDVPKRLTDGNKLIDKMSPQEQNAVRRVLAELPPEMAMKAYEIPAGMRKPGARLAKIIQGMTGEGWQMVEFWLRILNDENQELQIRMQAAKELADRGFGRPPQEIQQEITSTHTIIAQRLTGLSDDDLAALDNPADLAKYEVIDVTDIS
jgi:hypothetical protein